MKKLIPILLFLFLAACSTNHPLQPTSTSVPVETQEVYGPEYLFRFEQFAHIIPGKSTYKDVYGIVLDANGKTLYTATAGYGMCTRIITEKTNYIDFQFGMETEPQLRAVVHSIPSIDAWLESKGYASADSADGLSPTLPVSEIVFGQITQDEQKEKVVHLRQFIDIVPGESTLWDVYKIVEESGLGGCRMTPCSKGWYIELPAKDSNALRIIMDPDFVIMELTYCVRDM